MSTIVLSGDETAVAQRCFEKTRFSTGIEISALEALAMMRYIKLRFTLHYITHYITSTATLSMPAISGTAQVYRCELTVSLVRLDEFLLRLRSDCLTVCVSVCIRLHISTRAQQ